MTNSEVYEALKSKRTVIYSGSAIGVGDIAGTVTAIRLRYENEADIVSAEVKTYGPSHSVIICRPEDIDYWDATIKKGE